jgi:hypothetical protein
VFQPRDCLAQFLISIDNRARSLWLSVRRTKLQSMGQGGEVLSAKFRLLKRKAIRRSDLTEKKAESPQQFSGFLP